ncbi:MAG TPA: hypothetical protein ENK48_05745 [Gammaproteobacteria bacterium]|nr:hypothetical protein [Gammaproteobacteria bacterium]
MRAWFGILYAVLLFLAGPVAGKAQEPHSDVAVMGAFTSQEVEEGEAVQITDQEKRIVMFSMGIALLVLLLITAFLGISMAIQGKDVFVAHMICAGLSVTLAIAHSVVAIVWFFPF